MSILAASDQAALAGPALRAEGSAAQAGPVLPERPVQHNGATWSGQTGTASYYGPSFDGHLAADGERFDQSALTAAHPWLPFGTKVKVTLANSDRSVIVTITDRMPPGRRIVDLSVGAAERLGIMQRGVAEVSLTPACRFSGGRWARMIGAC